MPGVKGPARKSTDILDIWSCFFTYDMLNLVTQNSNLYICQQRYSQEYRTERPTDVTEIKALIRLLYLSAVRRTNHLNAGDLWKNNATSIELFRLVSHYNDFDFYSET